MQAARRTTSLEGVLAGSDLVVLRHPRAVVLTAEVLEDARRLESISFAIPSKTSRSSSSAPGAVRISITWRSVRRFAVQMMSVERPIGASRRSADVTSFLTWKGTL